MIDNQFGPRDVVQVITGPMDMNKMDLQQKMKLWIECSIRLKNAIALEGLLCFNHLQEEREVVLDRELQSVFAMHLVIMRIL